ncbi:MAG: translocation/assembly module TamB domain-containing protein [Deltaproteobacteria bacterium]|nr:translocation/assembly module TamB domain-containing protein [Deltaproteobacteria bacterium]
MTSKKKKRRTVVLVFLAGLVFFLVSFHLVLNREQTQKLLIDSANQLFGIAISADRLYFNGATGHFSGKRLNIRVPKAHLSVSLRGFSIAVSPVSLIFGKVRLTDLRAETVSIDLEALSKISADDSKREKRDISGILNNLTIQNARINNITVTFPDLQTLRVNEITVSSRIPLLFYSRGINVTVKNIAYRSTRLDFFADELTAEGSFKAKYNAFARKNEPYLDGRLRLNSSLLAAPKTPTPWNPAPAWDDSLKPLLTQKYEDQIPDNRAFIFFDNLDLPFHFDPFLMRVDDGMLTAFGGKLSIKAEWDKKSGKAAYQIENRIPFRLSLLPLGKAKFRQSFEKAGVELSGSGNLGSLSKGNVKGKLSVRLYKNRIVPAKENLFLTAVTDFKDGLLGVNDLKITLADGTVSARGTIDLAKKTLTSSYIGKNLDAQTVVRFFSTIDIPGLADLSGGITGKLNNPTFDLTLASPEAGYENLTFGSFNGKLLIRDKNLRLTGTTTLAGSGTGRIDLDIVEVFRSSRQTVSLKTDFKNLPLGPLFKSETIGGSLSGFFNMTKEKQNYDGKGSLDVADMVWHKIKIQKMAGQLGLKDKVLTVSGIKIVAGPSQPTLAPSKPLVFTFTPEGYLFSGYVLPTVSVEGRRLASDPDNLLMKLRASKTPLDFLAPLVPMAMEKFSTTGDFDVIYRLSSPIDSGITADLTAFEFTGEEKNIHLIGKTRVDFENRKITFHQSPFTVGKGRLTLDGPLGIEGGSALRAKGSLDLYQLTGLFSWLVEGNGLVDLDVMWEGSVKTPSYDGRITFKNAELFFRDLKRDLTELNGTLKISGNRYTFENFHMNYDEAPVTLQGWLEWASPAILAADLDLRGTEIPLSKPDTWRLFTDANVHLTGSGGGLSLAGQLNIVEGLYYRDYSLSEFILRPVGVKHDEGKSLVPEAFKNVNLSLKVKSAGEFEIKNNLAEVALKSDISLFGTPLQPQAVGNIDIIEGEIHAFGIDFEDATGFASFIRDRGLSPYLEFSASHAIQDFEVRVKIKGPSDNLALTLESTPTLNQNDIVSLIAYGRTPDQLSQGDQGFFSRTAIASQIVGLLQRPLSKATRLDIVRLEAQYGQEHPVLSRVSVGKQLSPRFAIAFTSDLTLDEALKGVQVEYQIFDNVLLKGVKDTGSRYRFDLTLRLQAY